MKKSDYASEIELYYLATEQCISYAWNFEVDSRCLTQK